MHKKNYKSAGKKISEASKALIMIHGRGGNSEEVLKLAQHLPLSDFTILAPQAYNNSWYPLSFLAPEEQNQPWLDTALGILREIELELNEKGIASDNIYFFGFSQGACLALEYITRNAKRYGGAVAIIGGLIGETINTGNYISNFEKTPVFIGTSDPDTHVPLERVEKTAEILRQKNAEILLKVYQNAGHRVLIEEIEQAKDFIFNRIS